MDIKWFNSKDTNSKHSSYLSVLDFLKSLFYEIDFMSISKIEISKNQGQIDNTANVYRQTTDKLMFKSVISTVRWIRK